MRLVIQATLLAILVAAVVLLGSRRMGFSVQWERRERDGVRFESGLRQQKGQSVGIALRFKVPDGHRFSLRRETGFDRLGKRLRLAVEPQLGTDSFDERYYIECPDPELLRELRERPELLQSLRALDARIGARGRGLEEIRCQKGNVEVLLAGTAADQRDEAEAAALAWLTPFVHTLRLLPARKVRYADRTMAPSLVHVAAWLMGLIGGAVVSEYASERLVAPGALFLATVPWSLAALAASLAWTWVRVGPTAPRHRVLATCLLIGTPGFVLSGFLLARAMNLALPQAPPETLPVQGAELLVTAHHKRGTRYAVAYGSKDSRIRSMSPLQLSPRDFERMRAGWGTQESRDAAVLLYPGALGAPWVRFVVVPDASG